MDWILTLVSTLIGVWVGGVLSVYTTSYQTARLRWKQAQAMARACMIYGRELRGFWPAVGPVNRPDEYRMWLQEALSLICEAEDPRFRDLGDVIAECNDENAAKAILAASRRLRSVLREGLGEATATNGPFAAADTALKELSERLQSYPRPVLTPWWHVKSRRSNVGGATPAPQEGDEDLGDAFDRGLD